MGSRPLLKEEYLPDTSDPVKRFDGDPYNAVDLIAVQGLGSNYETTWTAQDSNGDTYMWLRDLLPAKLNTTRVQTFQYDSRWYADPDHVTLRDCGKRLLLALLSDRTHQGQQHLCPSRRKRPLLLLGHSFGGLVINQAITFAAHVTPESREFCYKDCRDLLKATAGIIYLGTPFRGSTFARWGLRKAWLGSWVGVPHYPHILKALTLDSTTSILESSLEEFSKARDLQVLKDLQLFCFFETKEIALGIVVPRNSACLDGVPSEELSANHFEMNKFIPGRNFDQICKRISDFVTTAPSIVRQRHSSEIYGHPGARSDYQRIQTFLSPSAVTQAHAFEQNQARRDPDTCHWMNQHEIITCWRTFSNENNVAWMYGAPGSGKSVLSAALVRSVEARLEELADCWATSDDTVCAVKAQRDELPAVAYYFGGFEDNMFPCWNILSTMVHQCLLQHCEHYQLISRIGNIVNKKEQTTQRSLETLLDLFREIVTMTGGIRMIIDGFNELRQWDQLIELLSRLAECRRIRIFFAGHPNDQPSGTQLKAIQQKGMAFNIKDLTDGDIHVFIRKRVDAYFQKWPDNAAFARELGPFLRDNNRGMYQWVSLVMDVIDRYGGSTIEAKRALNDFPRGLEGMYFKVFEKLLDRPPNLTNLIREALRFLAVNLQPITIRELWKYAHIALYFDVHDQSMAVSEAEIDVFREALGSLVTTHTMHKRFIEKSSPGEKIEEREDVIVELCHSSLRQLLLKQGQFNVDDDGKQLLEAFACEGSLAHRSATMVCLRIAQSSFRWPICYSYYALEAQEPDLIQYAWNYWFSHLLAAKCFEDEAVRGLVLQFWDQLLNEVIFFLGSMSLSITEPRVSLGPDTGGISKTAGLVDLERKFMKAISALDVLRGNGNIPAKWSQTNSCWKENNSFRRNTKSVEEYRSWLWWYRWHGSLSAVTAEISFHVRRNPSLLAETRTNMAPAMQAVQSLQELAMNLSVNPVRWNHLQRSHAFSAVAPILYASHTLESIMLWPISDLVPITSIGSWNVPEQDRAHSILQYTVSELETKPSKAEIAKRLREGRNFHKMPGTRFLIILAYIQIFQGRGTTRLFQAPVFNYWLNRSVHVGSELTRGRALFGSPERSITRSLLPIHESDLPSMMDATAALPVQAALLLAKGMKDCLQQSKWYIWPYVRWNHRRLGSAYTNYVLVSKQFWLYRRRYLLPALLLYVVRNQYFPTFGQHWQPNAYTQIKVAIVSPLDWIDHVISWGWWDLARYYFFYSLASGAFILQLGFTPRNRLLRECGEIYSAFWLLLILERAVCQVVNAILGISVPLALLIQLGTVLPTDATHSSFPKDVIEPLIEVGTTIVLVVGIRMAFALLVLYFTRTTGVLLSLAKQAIIGASAALILTFFILLIPLVLELVFRFSAEKSSAEVFLLSLLAAGMVFFVLEVLTRVEEDPWGLDKVWQGYTSVVQKAEKLTGAKVKTLQASIDEHLVEVATADSPPAQSQALAPGSTEHEDGGRRPAIAVAPAHDSDHDPWGFLKEI